jgi:hypothetical protein
MKSFKDSSKPGFFFGLTSKSSTPQYSNTPTSQYGTTTYQPENFVPQQKQQEGTFLDKTENFFKAIGKDIEKVFVGEEPKETSLGRISLLEEPQPVVKSKPVTSKKNFAKKQSLTPAKKFMRVKSGKAQASPQEESALIENLDASMIAEFIEALDDKDWKVKVRAIRGLELSGQTFGYDDILPCKSTISELCYAPQLSLKTAASNFLELLNSAPTGGFVFTQSSPVEPVIAVQPNDEIINFHE